MEIHKNHRIDQLAAVNGVVTGLALYPQLFLAIKSGSVNDLSPWAFALIFTNSIVWVAYAMHRNIKPLAIASFLNAIASGLIVFLVLRA